jgi:hypothetical protein
MIYTNRPLDCDCSFCEMLKGFNDMKERDQNGYECTNDEAPFNPYEPGLDPKIKYTQKFHYAPADLYPRHYNTKNK